MRRRALIIGSQTYGLSAVHGDADRVAKAMAGLGFEVDRCAGEDATREGILAGYRRLIDACSSDDVAFVYYSGHGAWSIDAADPGPVQFIVPVDFEASTEDDFRGIAAPELSALLGELTSRTRNVTTVLDCCFAAGMARGVGPLVKALAAPPRLEVGPHLRRLSAQGRALGGPDVESNPDAIRLMASGVDQPAYEHTTQDGLRTGILTDSFLAVLREAQGVRISWAVFGRRVRERVMARFPEQRPEIEGPIRRALFEVEEVEQARALAYCRERGLHWLRGGRILGLKEGDEYAVMPLDALGPARPGHLALATVVEVSGDRSRVALDRPGSHIPEGAPAFLVRSAQRRRPVRLASTSGEGGDALWRILKDHIHASHVLCLQVEGDDSPALGSVVSGAGGIEVLDGEGDPIAMPRPATPTGAAEAVRRLENLARAQAVRELEDGTEDSRMGPRLILEWGRIVDGAAKRLPTVGAYLRTGDRIYVRIDNQGPVRLYASVLDVGVAGQITLLNRSQPSGIRLGPGQSEILGRRPGGKLEGLLLEWPEDVPRTGPRLESLVLVISDAPQDLRALETDGYRSASVALVHHAVRQISFWLSPHAPANG
jgi:hypothetical protein